MCLSHPIKKFVISEDLTGRKLALVVLGSNIWLVVRDHGAEIAARVDATRPGSFGFIEMPLPLRSRRNSVKVRNRRPDRPPCEATGPGTVKPWNLHRTGGVG